METLKQIRESLSDDKFVVSKEYLSENNPQMTQFEDFPSTTMKTLTGKKLMIVWKKSGMVRFAAKCDKQRKYTFDIQDFYEKSEGIANPVVTWNSETKEYTVSGNVEFTVARIDGQLEFGGSASTDPLDSLNEDQRDMYDLKIKKGATKEEALAAALKA